MAKRLRKKLTLLYTLLTGFILTAVVITVCCISEASAASKIKQQLTLQLMTICNKLQFEPTLSHDWLNQIERDNNCIIYIEENQTPLLYRGAYQSATPRDALAAKAKAAALEENVDTSIPPVYVHFRQSSIFHLKGSYHDTYQASVALFLPMVDFIVLSFWRISHRPYKIS